MLSNGSNSTPPLLRFFPAEAIGRLSAATTQQISQLFHENKSELSIILERRDGSTRPFQLPGKSRLLTSAIGRLEMLKIGQVRVSRLQGDIFMPEVEVRILPAFQ
jgi:hypothetical protein